jgi:hypothetical protein
VARETSLATLLASPLYLAHHTTKRLLSRLALSLDHTTASRLRTAILIDHMRRNLAKHTRHRPPTTQTRITVDVWSRYNVSLASLLKIPVQTQIRTVNDAAESASFVKLNVKAAKRMATAARHLATMTTLHPRAALAPASRMMPVKLQAKALGHRHLRTMVNSKSFDVVPACLTRQWTLA